MRPTWEDGGERWQVARETELHARRGGHPDGSSSLHVECPPGPVHLHLCAGAVPVSACPAGDAGQHDGEVRRGKYSPLETSALLLNLAVCVNVCLPGCCEIYFS